MAGTYYEAKNAGTLFKRLKKKDNMLFVQKAGSTLQKRARKGYKMYYVIIDKKKKK